MLVHNTTANRVERNPPEAIMNSASKVVTNKNSAGSGSETGTAPAQEDTPRDVRLLHLLLASQSIHQYEDQVPLQLMDFAHRYTQGVLKDALVYNDYAGTGNAAGSGLGVEDIRLAIAARTQYQFKPTAPKELMLQLAAERNKKALPQVMGTWGVRLPPEKYCLTAKEWNNEDPKSS